MSVSLADEWERELERAAAVLARDQADRARILHLAVSLLTENRTLRTELESALAVGEQLVSILKEHERRRCGIHIAFDQAIDTTVREAQQAYTEHRTHQPPGDNQP